MTLDLALVIPVRDDAEGLARLLSDPVTQGLGAEIVVVDDASDPPLDQVVDAAGLRAPIRLDRPVGGGAARNRGLAAVTARYLMFVDADDRLVPGIVPLLADLAEAGRFDFCQFKYADGREVRAGHWGQPGWDEHHWFAAGAALGALRDLAPEARPALAQTANYPWNKVWRTGFLRDNGIACAETRVHNDMALHWGGYLAAARVLASDRIGVWHEVRTAGGRLTNRMGRERLELPTALAPVRAAVGRHSDPAWRIALVRFLLGLCDWIRGRIAADVRADWITLEQGLFQGLSQEWGDEIARTDPGLAARLAEPGAA